ncbi:MAG: enoyl-CoA hydratase/isomerase family protein [Pseudomonadota bacterium]
MSNVVLSKQLNDIRIITLNRPNCLNAINSSMIKAFLHELKSANTDDSVKAIVLCGAGKAFCSGDDIEDTLNSISQEEILESQAEYAEDLQNITREMLNGNKFIIGAIHGWAVGAGFEWAINCDFSIWTESARAFFPEMKWGMFPTGGVTYLLPHIVGLIKARELLLFGEKQNSKQLLKMGIAWKVVADDQLMDKAIEVANKIIALPEGSVQGLKKTINKACFNKFENVLDMEMAEVLKAINNPITSELLKKFKNNS